MGDLRASAGGLHPVLVAKAAAGEFRLIDEEPAWHELDHREAHLAPPPELDRDPGPDCEVTVELTGFEVMVPIRPARRVCP